MRIIPKTGRLSFTGSSVGSRFKAQGTRCQGPRDTEPSHVPEWDQLSRSFVSAPELTRPMKRSFSIIFCTHKHTQRNTQACRMNPELGSSSATVVTFVISSHQINTSLVFRYLPQTNYNRAHMTIQDVLNVACTTHKDLQEQLL